MNKRSVIALVIVVAVLLLGQVLSYYTAPAKFGISTGIDGDTISYTVKSGMDLQFTELHLDNGTYQSPSRFVVLKDDRYPTSTDADFMRTTGYFLDRTFERCPSISYEYRDADAVASMMDSDMSAGTFGAGLIVLTGTVPDVLYDGSIDSRMIKWMEAGGSLYWCGGCFGMTYSTLDDGIKFVGDHSAVVAHLLGDGTAIRIGDEDTYGSERVNPCLTELSGMYHAGTRYGVDPTKVTPQMMSLGYTDGQYVSMAMIAIDNGMLTVFGDYVGYQNVQYLAHVLLLRMNYSTEIDYDVTGYIKHGTYSNSFEDSPGILHAVILHDLKWARAWIYDRDQGKFV